MAKKKPATEEQPAAPVSETPPAESKKVPGRTLGNWRTEFQTANPNATTQEIADAINSRAKAEGFVSPEWTAEKVAAAQLRDNQSDGQEGGDGTRTTRARAAAAPVAPSGPSLADLLAVKECADKEGGAKALLAQVVAVDELAQKTGGLSQLRKCLEALVLLTGGK